jgi:phenylpyruvate tautomerase PptA (4-oxalocrotonate tautomerase family)
MRKLTIKSTLSDVYVSDWTTYINDKSITDIIKDNIESGNFKAKITIIIEELETDLIIQGNKPKEDTQNEGNNEQ